MARRDGQRPHARPQFHQPETCSPSSLPPTGPVLKVLYIVPSCSKYTARALTFENVWQAPVDRPLLDTQDAREVRVQNQPLLDTQDGASYRQAMQGEGAPYEGARDQRQPAPVPSVNIGPSANDIDFDSYQFKADHNSPEDRRRQQTFLPRLDGLDQSSFVAQVCLLAILDP